MFRHLTARGHLSMDYKDYYRTLGVKKGATEAEIRKAYRQLARKHHPDVNPNDPKSEQRFKEINEAYEVLQDPDKRAKYDQLGANWQQYQRAGGDPNGFDWTQWASSAGGPSQGGRAYSQQFDINDLFGNSSYSDFFQRIFGDLRGARGQAAGPTYAMGGRDLEQPVDVSLEEAYHGTARVLQVNGRRLEIKIPAGVSEGSRVRLAGEGEPGGNGGRPGDIILRVAVLPHERYQREGNDLRVTQPVDLYTLLLGGEVTVETFKGRVSLTIPPETRAGQSFRLRGRGMPVLRREGEFGDLIVEVMPALPRDLSDREKELLRELARLRP
jgi:curved DNA-binding protein